MAEGFSLVLKKQGYLTLTAGSGQEAVEHAVPMIPHLILVDIELPDVNEWTVSRQLAADYVTVSIPIIVVSGNDSEDIVRERRSVGCRYFSRKPCDANSLLLGIQPSLVDIN